MISYLDTLPVDLTPEDYQDRLRTIGRVGRHLMFALGDMLLYGEMRWGEQAAQYAEAAGYKPKTLLNALWVARTIPPECRHEALSFGHHAAVAALPEATRDGLLHAAAEETARGAPPSVHDLRLRAQSVGAQAQTHRSLWTVGDALAQAALDYVRGCQHQARIPGSDPPDPRDVLAVAEEWRIRRHI